MKKKNFLLTLLVAILFMVFSTNAYAAELYGNVKVISEGTSSVDNNKTANVTVKYTAGNLKWYEKDLNVGRNVNGYWIGIRIDAPSGRADNAKYKRGGTTVTFNNVKDGNDYVNAWINVTQEQLKKIKENGEPYVILEYEFDWNGDGNFNDQKISVQVDPDKIVLDEVPEGFVKVTVNSLVGNRTFTVKKGTSLNEDLSTTEKDYLNQLIKAPAGKKYIGIFKGEEKFSLDEKINDNITLTVKFEDALDEAPKTGVKDSLLSSLLFISISSIGMITIKKKLY